MNMLASSCHVCGRKYEPGEEYMQVEVETSKPPNEEVYGPSGPPKRVWLVPFDATPEQVRMSHFGFQLGSWMRTSWVCFRCVEMLPLEWKQIFSRPSLSEWVPLEQLKDQGDSEVWVAKRRDS